MNLLTKTFFVVVILSLSVISCLKSVVPEPEAFTSLTYLNSGAFDHTLSTAMDNGTIDIEVTVLEPFTPETVPEKLDTWLTVISESGGKVKTEPVEPAYGDRNVLSFALTLLSMYDELVELSKYLPARYYNARLLYRLDNQGKPLIETVVFSHR